MHITNLCTCLLEVPWSVFIPVLSDRCIFMLNCIAVTGVH